MYLSAPIVFECQQMVRDSASALDALARVSGLLAKSKQNTIVSELAKRAATFAFPNDEPVGRWRENLFTQVTDYLVSRDLPGYVGPAFRNRTVADVVTFKTELLARVRTLVRSVTPDPQSPTSWSLYVRDVTRRLSQLAQ
jgi:hypothetical protein